MGDDFRIYFVKPDSDEENNSRLIEAFETLDKAGYNFKPEWIKPEECLTMDGKGKQIYIFDPFEGPAFEHLKACGYRIYGPHCILANLLHGMDLPKSKKWPIYNLAMKEVKVCCTSMDRSSRDDITKKVRLMAGEVDSNLTADVTHLVAGEVGSNKYLVAVEKGKLVMVKDWVYKVWEASQDKHIMATDKLFDKYACPPFLGLTVVVSGFSSSERNQMRAFVTRGGGKYSGELKMDECTHLVVKEPKGAKYEAAKKWQIRIVRDRWLFDSMDKGRYLDPKPYQFDECPQDKNVKTSTPERRSTVAPHISDISAISNTGLNSSVGRVDETTDLTSTRLSERFNVTGRNFAVADSKMMNTAVDADTTITPADVFLDGCRIYLSGVTPAAEERLKKIIPAGGGLRAMELDQNVTHVVIGEVIASDILIVNRMAECPHVVSQDWLMDCFHRNTHLCEEKYLRTDLGLRMVAKANKAQTKPERNSNQRDTSSHPAPSVSEDEKREGNDKISNNKTQESQAFKADAPSDLEMAELLSQYMDPPDGPQQNPTECQDSEVQIMMVENGKNDEKDSTIKAGKDDHDEEEEEAQTQDPQDMTESGEERGIFYKKTFIILGFDEDETAQLTEFVETRGGRVFSSGKTRQVADIAIVPLMGFPVDVTVSDILTNAWLQMCIEADTLLPYDDHWLSRPIELPEKEPLVGCCISVSGYVGVERECIMHLAQSLGANCQDHFARKSSKNVQASTHLIVNHPTGTKYDAAKKWKIPAVGKEWIFACIKTGERMSEDEYFIEHLEQKCLEAEQAASKSCLTVTEGLQRRNSLNASLPTPPRMNTDNSDEPQECSKNDHVFTDQEVAESNIDDNKRAASTSASNGPSESKAEDRVPTSSIESSDSNNRNAVDTNPLAEVQRHLSTASPVHQNPSTSAAASRKSACRPNQSENITAGSVNTPKKVWKQKWGLPDYEDSPAASSTPMGLIHGGGETPGTFMHPGFKPKFNLTGMFTTPDTNADLNKSTPLGEIFRRQITKAAQNAATDSSSAVRCGEGEMPASQSQVEALPPLHGVVIAVAKKLGRSHEQYNNIVVELGGNYSWHNGQQVTHFVFQGRPNDVNKEFRKAREEGKIIVSPYWLYACKEQNCRVDESLYPHNYNPSYSLTMTPSAKTTPSRSTRAAGRNKGPPDSTSRTGTAVGKTPGKKMPVLNLQEVSVKETSPTTPKSRAARGSTSPVPHGHDGLDHSVDNEKMAASTVTRKEHSVNVSIDTPSGPVTEASSGGGDSTRESSANKSKNQEMKEALSNVLAEASRSRRSNRKKIKRRNLSGQLNASDGNTPQDSLPRTGTSAWTNKEPKTTAAAPEPSQSVQVTWEDPTEKLEKEKLAHRLERMCEPSQNTDDLLACIEVPDQSSKSRMSARSASSFSDRSPTPEPPSLAFPLAKPTSNVLPPQPVELLSEESSDSRMSNPSRAVPVFLISGMQNQERVDYSALVEQLGGKMVEKQHFDPASTHLVVGQPARNEKYLSCVASGKWVLHKSYFEACRKEGKFVKEDPHEWGSKYTLPLMQNMTSQANKLAAAAYKWRKRLADIKKINPSCEGAFDGWKVLLCLDRNKEENFQRLLEAGGAKVTTIRPPFPQVVKGTHAFLDLNKIKIDQEDLEKLIEAEIHCLKTEFIPAFLTDEPPPDPSEFYPAEIVALKACMPDVRPSRKRRLASANEEQSSSNKTLRR